MFRLKFARLAVAVALATGWLASHAYADWTEFSLPNLPEAYAPTAFANLPDGRFVFATEGNYYLQDTFGSAGYSAFSNVAPGNNADPSFIAIENATNAVAGGTGYGLSDLYQFNPSALTAPTFVAQGLSLQTYSGVFRDSTSLYVGGANGTGGTHSIAYVNLTAATTKVIIDNVSTYSCGFAQDSAGNLYVGDDDNGDVYKFTAAQLSLAITGTALAITDGTLIHQFSDGLGSLAVDAQGRLWAAGYLENGLQMYDPTANTETTVIPGLTNANYMVTAFAVAGQGYVAYTDEANPGAGGTAQFYGFAAVPEPGTVLLTLVGLTALATMRRRLWR